VFMKERNAGLNNSVTLVLVVVVIAMAVAVINQQGQIDDLVIVKNVLESPGGDFSSLGVIVGTEQADKITATLLPDGRYEFNIQTANGEGSNTQYSEPGGIIVIYGLDGNDIIEMSGLRVRVIIYGGGGDDYMDGGSGNDILRGEDGDDNIYGGEGNDILRGEDGDDNMYGGEGNDILLGEDGDDNMRGGEGDDYMFGGSGNDVMSGGEGNDDMFGGSGNDYMRGGSGNDYMRGGSGNDDMDGGEGNDFMCGDGDKDRMTDSDGVNYASGGPDSSDDDIDHITLSGSGSVAEGDKPFLPADPQDYVLATLKHVDAFGEVSICASADYPQNTPPDSTAPWPVRVADTLRDAFVRGGRTPPSSGGTTPPSSPGRGPASPGTPD
jgi:Ca2+-binding RTX toxin-like protein